MKSEFIYLDYAAATPIDRKVYTAMEPYFSVDFYNPSAPYAPAIAVRQKYNQAKQAIAHIIGAKADEITITAGATESINLAFATASDYVVTDSIEHHAVLAAANQFKHLTLVQPNAKGLVLASSVKQAINDQTQLVSVALVNNELGVIQPVREIAEVINEERQHRLKQGNTTPIYFHCDSSQGAGQLDVMVSRLGVDMLTLSAAKVYGPKQVGLLWAAPFVKIVPKIVGGGQEQGRRSGTENVAGVVGFATALSLAGQHRKYETKRLTQLRNNMQKQLCATFPEAVVSGDQKRRLASYLHISFPNLDAERVLFALESRGVLVATGSACAANQGTRSHVLTAIGLEPNVADGSFRITLGHGSTEENTQKATQLIIEEVTKEYARSQK